VSDLPQENKPKRRWGRWIGLSFLLLIVLLVGGHAIWGWWEERKLNEEVGALRAKGEPFLPEELANSPVADGDNAVVVLLEGARSINRGTAVWRQLDHLELAFPLSDAESEVLRRVLAENRTALAKLREARAPSPATDGSLWARPPAAHANLTGLAASFNQLVDYGRSE